MNKENHSKYLILQNSALTSANDQKNMLQDMRNYMGMSNLKHEMDIERKKKVFNELEFQVFSMKNDALNAQEKIKEMKIFRNQIITKISVLNKKNKKLEKDKFILIKDYVYMNFKLAQISNNLKVNDLEMIILKFNEHKLVYQSYYADFTNVNENLIHLNNEFTSLSFELKKIKEGLLLKDENLKKFEDDFDVLQAQTQFQELKSFNEIKTEKLFFFHKTLMNIFKFLKIYDLKLNDILSNINLIYSKIKQIKINF